MYPPQNPDSSPNDQPPAQGNWPSTNPNAQSQWPSPQPGTPGQAQGQWIPQDQPTQQQPYPGYQQMPYQQNYQQMPPQGYGMYQAPMPVYKVHVGRSNTGARLLIFLVFFIIIFGAVGYFMINIFNQAKGTVNQALESVNNMAGSTQDPSAYPGAEKLALNPTYRNNFTGFTNLKIDLFASSDSFDSIVEYYRNDFKNKGYNLSTVETGDFVNGQTRRFQAFGSNGARAELRVLNQKDISAALSDASAAQGRIIFVVASSNPMANIKF
jgi:uncharacterized protein YpmB